MKLKRKLLSLLICVLMLASALPMGVFAADELLVSDYDVYLPFDDATNEQVVTYFNKHAEGSNLVYAGNTGKVGSTYYWANYVTEDNGNKYVYEANTTNYGYTFANAEGYDNFSKIFQLSFRMKLDPHSTTKTNGLYIPVLRGSIATGTGTSSGSGTANLLAVANTAEYPGEAIKADGSKNLIGYLIPGTGNSTGYTHTGYGIYSDTWYDIVFMADKATGSCWFSVTDGTNDYELAYSHSTLKGLSILNKMMLFRTFQKADAAVVSLDDVRLTNHNFVVKSGMNGLVYAVQDGVPMNYANTTFYLPGFTTEGTANANWELVTEENGNKYLSHLNGTSTKSPITIKDSFDLLDGNDFSLSLDYKWGEGVPPSGVGMLSLKIDKQGSTEEFRIINLGQGGGLYFGPAIWKDFQIGTLTTPDSEGGAQWHNLKVVFKPYVSEDYNDMNYEFYIDGNLAAYTDVVEGEDDDGNATYSYNFYTKASGTWTAVTNLQPAKLAYVGLDDKGAPKYEWKGKAYGANCSWGESKDNIGRLPMGYWDGYAQIDAEENETIVHRDGEIATIASIYMFHWNNASFAIDNFEVDCSESEREMIETAKIVGYQLGHDGTSVRFIACGDSLNFGQIGMDIDVFAPEADMATASTAEPLWATKATKMNNSVFIALTADGEQISAKEEFGARYFAMLSVYDIDSAASIRVRPYTTRDGVKIYGEAAEYHITFKNGVVAVEAIEEHTADYSDGFVASGAQNGYCYNAWSSYTWDLLTTGVKADIGWGGESGSREAALQDDGSIKLNTSLYFKTSHKIQADVPVLDEEGNPTYDGDGKPVTQKVDVKDNEGNQLYNNSSFSRRIKFAGIIPTNLEDYKGYTFVLTAKVKATQANIKTTRETVVGEGENAVTYNAVYDEEDPDGKCGIAFGFMTDYKTNMLACNTYSISADGEWVEIQAVLNVTDALLKNANVAPAEKDRAPVTDAEGVVHPAPLRPTINLSDNFEDGYARELYVKDITLTVIPTPAK